MLVADGVWDGTGGALVGSFLAGVVALGTLFLTRRNDRALLREQVGLDAAARIAQDSVYVANALASDATGGKVVTYRDFLDTYLHSAMKFRHCVLMDAPILPDANLRRLLFFTAEWLTNGLIHRMGYQEGAALTSGADWPTELAKIKDEEHAHFVDVLRHLIEWRMHGKVDV